MMNDEDMEAGGLCLFENTIPKGENCEKGTKSSVKIISNHAET
jgi:hypothetical protein